MKRYLWLLIAPAICLAIFWRAPFIWFDADDFAWLSLPMQVHGIGDLGSVLFHPFAQGTVRVLSDRLYFLTLTGMFGVQAWPFRVVTIGFWILDLILIQLIGAKLTGSRKAGTLAALLWGISASIVVSVVWASAFNQILCAFLMLLAFYWRLLWIETNERKWKWLEAAAYLLGFGALEVIVVYPAVVLVHAACDPRTRKHWRGALWMFVPAIAFGLVHLFLIPHPTTSIYAIGLNKTVLYNLGKYFFWAAGPSRMGLADPERRTQGLIGTAMIVAALGTFLLWRVRRKEYAGLFCCAWFVLTLAPVLPIPNQVQDYYLTIPAIGLAWLGGSAMVAGWQAGAVLRMGVAVLGAIYFIGSFMEVNAYTSWYLNRTSHTRSAFRGAEGELAKYPGVALVLVGVDDDLAASAFRDNAFRLLGTNPVYLPPSQTPEDLSRYGIKGDDLLPLLTSGQARAIDVSQVPAKDVTASYKLTLTTQFLSHHRSFIDVGQPIYESLLGSGWYGIENNGRWMGSKASVFLDQPSLPTKLKIAGFAPEAALASGPVKLTFWASGHALGSVTVDEGGETFEGEFRWPGEIPSGRAEITIACNKTFHAPGDPRELGMVFGTFKLE